MKTVACLSLSTIIIMSITLLNSTPLVAQDAQFQVSLGQRQLFFDDYGIAQIKGLQRFLHRPSKKGAVIRPTLQAGEYAVTTRTAPVWQPDQKKYLFWYGAHTNFAGFQAAYAESADGLHWVKPPIHQKTVNGSNENNYFDPILPRCVVYDPDDPDLTRRFKGFANDIKVGLIPIVSPDGLVWTKLPIDPIPSSDEFNLSYDPLKKLFIATPKSGGPYGRAVTLSTSPDFEHWTKPELIFFADDLDQQLGVENIKAFLADARLQQPFWNDPQVYNVDVYNMGIFRYEGLYIGLPTFYHAIGPMPVHPNTVGFHIVELACSRDLKNWLRLGDRKPFIAPSPTEAGAYDLQQIIGPSYPVVHNDELWFYYQGVKYRGEFEYPDAQELDPDTSAICLAVLRRDGFISLNVSNTLGSVTTKIFTLPGDKLFVNVDAHDGSLQVAVLDPAGQTLAQSQPIATDQSHALVTWQSTNLSSLKNKPIALSFTLTNAKLYSYWLEN